MYGKERYVNPDVCVFYMCSEPFLKLERQSAALKVVTMLSLFFFWGGGSELPSCSWGLYLFLRGRFRRNRRPQSSLQTLVHIESLQRGGTLQGGERIRRQLLKRDSKWKRSKRKKEVADTDWKASAERKSYGQLKPQTAEPWTEQTRHTCGSDGMDVMTDDFIFSFSSSEDR